MTQPQVLTISQTVSEGLRVYVRSIPDLALFMLVPSVVAALPSIFANANPTAALAFGFASVVAWAYAGAVATRYCSAVARDPSVQPDPMALLRSSDGVYALTLVLWLVVCFLSLLLLVIPFIYLSSLVVLLGYPVVFLEGRTGLGGIWRMCALARGRWWKTTGIVTVLSLVLAVPVSLVVILSVVGSADAAGGIERLLQNPTSPLTITPLYAASVTVQILVGTFTGPLFIAMGVVHYWSLRAEKQEVDPEPAPLPLSTTNLAP